MRNDRFGPGQVRADGIAPVADRLGGRVLMGLLTLWHQRQLVQDALHRDWTGVRFGFVRVF